MHCVLPGVISLSVDRQYRIVDVDRTPECNRAHREGREGGTKRYTHERLAATCTPISYPSLWNETVDYYWLAYTLVTVAGVSRRLSSVCRRL